MVQYILGIRTSLINVDTHILIDYLNGSIRGREESLLEDSDWMISAATLWEIRGLWRRQRIDVDLWDPEVNRVLSELQIWPVDRRVAEAALGLDFTSDPADEMIAATSIVHEAPLLTRDRVIRASKVVPLVL